jgi:hypothetical protein
MSFTATAIAMQTGNPVHVQGNPGVGKSDIMTQFASETGKHLETRIASLCDPTDFAGLPIMDKKGGVVYAAPRWAMNISEHGGGILFLDEIGGAPPTVQMGLLRVCLDKVVGDHELPKRDTWVVACSNPTDQTPGGFDFAPPLANRFCHIPWEFSPLTWINGLTTGFPSPEFPTLPDNWEDFILEGRTMVASFTKVRQELISALPKEESSRSGAWPSPRSWTVAADMMGAARSVGATDDTLMELVGGCVGNGAATEFITYINELDLPEPKDVLSKGQKFKLPKDGDKQFAILNSCAAYTLQNLNEDNWLKMWDVLEGAAKQGAVDVAAGVCPNLSKAWQRDQTLPIVESAIDAFIPILQKAGTFKGGD